MGDPPSLSCSLGEGRAAGSSSLSSVPIFSVFFCTFSLSCRAKDEPGPLVSPHHFFHFLSCKTSSGNNARYPAVALVTPLLSCHFLIRSHFFSLQVLVVARARPVNRR